MANSPEILDSPFESVRTSPRGSKLAPRDFANSLQTRKPSEINEKLDFKEVVKVIIEKCISSGKSQIKKISIENLCYLFEKLEEKDLNLNIFEPITMTL